MELLKIFVLLVMSACVCHGVKFVMVNGTFNFTEAQQACKQRGMKLATIYGYKEQLDARKVTRKSQHPGCADYVSQHGTGCRVFINYEKISDGKFRPIGGKSDYTYWDERQPLNEGMNENCIELTSAGDEARWNDVTCTAGIGALCEERFMFVMFNGTFKFHEAKAECERHGMQVATIYNLGEQHQARKVSLVRDHQNCVHSPGQEGCKAFINFGRIHTGGSVCAIGPGSTYRYFGSWEPNNWGGNENCVEINNYGANGEWNDNSCNAGISALCEEGSIAFRKPARQSSTSNERNAGWAVDGNRNGDVSSGLSCSQTSGSGTLFWTVDLQKKAHVGDITITIPRTCCRDHFADLEVYLSEDSAITTYDHDGNRCAGYDGPPKAGETSITVSCGGMLGRHLSIVKPNGTLTLCEVDVDEVPPGFEKIATHPDNLAFRRPAQQTSTADDGDASRAVDGNRNGLFSIGQSCTRTSGNVEQSWSVQLRRKTYLTKVTITIPEDQNRMELRQLKVYATHGKPVLPTDNVDESQTLCGTYDGPTRPGDKKIDINCTGKDGKFVSIVKIPVGGLSMCEVEVFGREA